MKIALVGAGTITAQYLAAEALVADVVISDAYDPDEAALRRLPPRVRPHASLAAMLAHSGADVFVVATPSETHLRILGELLDAGAFVAVEKPMVIDRDELFALERAVGDGVGTVYGMLHFAFAAEVIAWRERSATDADRLGALRAGYSGFYDPYVTGGSLLPRAGGLAGSWLDSGINALSVLAALFDGAAFRLRSASMTVLPGLACRQAAGSAFYEAQLGSRRTLFGIDTNWTLGIDSKVTQLYYERGVVTLDHSAESIALAWDDGRTEVVRLGTSAHRLATHYAGVFTDLQGRWKAKRGNFETVGALHRIFLDALKPAAETRLRHMTEPAPERC